MEKREEKSKRKAFEVNIPKTKNKFFCSLDKLAKLSNNVKVIIAESLWALGDDCKKRMAITKKIRRTVL